MGDCVEGPERGRTEAYASPSVSDLGGLVELTRTADLFFGHTASAAGDLSFSGPISPNHQGGGEHGGGVVGGAGAGAPAGGTAGGGAGSGGGTLPFTGYSVTVVAALGSALSAAGVAMRRALSRSY